MACGSRTYVCPPPSPICTASSLQTVRCGMRQLTHTHTYTHSGACVCTSIFTSITTSYNIKVCSMAYKKEAKDLPTYTYIHSRRRQTVGMCSRGGEGGMGIYKGRASITCQLGTSVLAVECVWPALHKFHICQPSQGRARCGGEVGVR